MSGRPLISQRPSLLKADPVGSISVKAVNDTSTRAGDEYTPEFSGIYMNTFADDTIGIAIIASRQERNNGVNAASVGGYYTRTGVGADQKLACGPAAICSDAD